MIHALKIHPEYFNAIRNRKKRFVLRNNDRDFHVGDYLALNEWDGHYTGRTELVKVTYMMNPSGVMTCQDDFVLMSIEPCRAFDSARRDR